VKNELDLWVAGRARELRKVSTPEEEALWRVLRGRRFAGFKFRRQEPMGRYIADFVCFRAKLVVELDGLQHLEQHDHDDNRDTWLKEQGFSVLRFWNEEWRSQPEAVLAVIGRALGGGESGVEDAPHPNPSPTRGEGLNAVAETLPSPLVGEGLGVRGSRT
jgi:very-short-patch-repair endonuclease